MVLLKSDDFITELSNLYSNIGSSSVTVTFKKYDGRTKPISKKPKKQIEQHNRNLCLVRAVFKKRKISTVVNVKEINKFQQLLSDVIKKHIHLIKPKRAKKTVP